MHVGAVRSLCVDIFGRAFFSPEEVTTPIFGRCQKHSQTWMYQTPLISQKPNGRSLSRSCTKLKSSSSGDGKRRDASYKPNIWSDDFIEGLCSDYKGGEFGKLKSDLQILFNQADSSASKRQFISTIVRLGLSDLFDEEGSVLLTFDDKLRDGGYDHQDSQLQKLILPLQREVSWFEVRKVIDNHNTEDHNQGVNLTLLNLAALNFNTVQSIHQEELKHLAKWWRGLGLTQEMSFARDRLVESFLFAVGVAHQPRYSSLRKCLAKVITFILLIDDVYDIYGFLDELECFTKAVDRWDVNEIHFLPESLKTCFRAFYDTTNDMARVIYEETGRSGILSLITKAWADFCKALLVEAQWYYTSYTPSLDEYLSSAWISSSGPLLSLIVVLHLSTMDKQVMNGGSVTEVKDDLVYHSSLIVRLCNDLGTFKAELDRGDAPSSILCYMREEEVAEDVARRKLRDIIEYSWEKMSALMVNRSPPKLLPSFNLLVNIARVARFTYSKGDGTGIQDGIVQELVQCILVEPVRQKT